MSSDSAFYRSAIGNNMVTIRNDGTLEQQAVDCCILPDRMAAVGASQADRVKAATHVIPWVMLDANAGVIAYQVYQNLLDAFGRYNAKSVAIPEVCVGDNGFGLTARQSADAIMEGIRLYAKARSKPLLITIVTQHPQEFADSLAAAGSKDNYHKLIADVLTVRPQSSVPVADARLT